MQHSDRKTVRHVYCCKNEKDTLTDKDFPKEIESTDVKIQIIKGMLMLIINGCQKVQKFKTKHNCYVLVYTIAQCVLTNKQIFTVIEDQLIKFTTHYILCVVITDTHKF